MCNTSWLEQWTFYESAPCSLRTWRTFKWTSIIIAFKCGAHERTDTLHDTYKASQQQKQKPTVPRMQIAHKSCATSFKILFYGQLRKLTVWKPKHYFKLQQANYIYVKRHITEGDKENGIPLVNTLHSKTAYKRWCKNIRYMSKWIYYTDAINFLLHLDSSDYPTGDSYKGESKWMQGLDSITFQLHSWHSENGRQVLTRD